MATQKRPPIAVEDIMGEHTRTPSSEQGIERLRSDLLAFQDLRSRASRRLRNFDPRPTPAAVNRDGDSLFNTSRMPTPVEAAQESFLTDVFGQFLAWRRFVNVNHLIHTRLHPLSEEPLPQPSKPLGIYANDLIRLQEQREQQQRHDEEVSDALRFRGRPAFRAARLREQLQTKRDERCTLYEDFREDEQHAAMSLCRSSQAPRQRSHLDSLLAASAGDIESTSVLSKRSQPESSSSASRGTASSSRAWEVVADRNRPRGHSTAKLTWPTNPSVKPDAQFLVYLDPKKTSGYSIGRWKTNLGDVDVNLHAFAELARRASHLHARVIWNQALESWVVESHGRNGTKVNGQLLKKGAQEILEDNAVIMAGNVQLRFNLDAGVSADSRPKASTLKAKASKQTTTATTSAAAPASIPVTEAEPTPAAGQTATAEASSSSAVDGSEKKKRKSGNPKKRARVAKTSTS